MALPSITAPEYSTTIPSTEQKITYRPFLVKEEKLLLIAQESGENQEQVLAVAKILAACITTPDIKVGEFATFDLEYLFLKLRSKSVGEIVQLSIPHQSPAEPSGNLENSCTHKTLVDINLEDIKVLPDIPERKIQLTDNIGVSLKFPTFQNLVDTDDLNKTEYLFDILTKCVEYVYDKDTVYSDFTQEEMSEWIDGLGQQQFQKISEFYENIPRVKHLVEWKCPACDKEESLTLEGLESFFS